MIKLIDKAFACTDKTLQMIKRPSVKNRIRRAFDSALDQAKDELADLETSILETLKGDVETDGKGVDVGVYVSVLDRKRVLKSTIADYEAVIEEIFVTKVEEDVVEPTNK